MKLQILPDAESVALNAARWIANVAREAVAARGRLTLAVSGGQAPLRMFQELAAQDVPWKGVHLFQVDERVAPVGDPARNLTQLRETLIGHVPLPPENLHVMPVEQPDLGAAAANYARELGAVTGTPAVFDVVHLGIGLDGHTASLVPGDLVLEVRDSDVAPTGVYAGHRRMTLTYPVLDRALRVLWLITGIEKAPVLARLLAGDRNIPAGRVRSDRALAWVDSAAAAKHASGT